MTTNADRTSADVASSTTNKEENKYLIFQLDQALYGIGIASIIEIIEYKQPTKVPNLPPFVHGLLNLRGKVLPIIDFNLYLGNKDTVISKKTCEIIVNYVSNNQPAIVGVLVDNVLDVIEVEPKMLEKTPDFGVKIKSEFIKNMFILNDQIIILLNVNNVFVNPILEPL